MHIAYKNPGVPFGNITKQVANDTENKISYIGRLDPLASGIIIYLEGDELKDRDKYMHLDKTYKFNIVLPAVVFPHPLSPTNPNVSPLAMENEIPSTALTVPVFLLKTIPPATGKCFLRFSTTIKGSSSFIMSIQLLNW